MDARVVWLTRFKQSLNPERAGLRVPVTARTAAGELNRQVDLPIGVAKSHDYRELSARCLMDVESRVAEL